MIPTDPGYDPVQAAFNLTRKNPAIDWEIEMLAHLKNGSFEQARRAGLRAADINIELAQAPEVDAPAATEHLIKAASILEQVREFARAAEVYAQAVARDPNPGTRIVEGRRVTTPLRQFDLEATAGRADQGRAVLEGAAKSARSRFDTAKREGRHDSAHGEAEFLADIALRLSDAKAAQEWLRESALEGASAGRQIREANAETGADPYELSRAAFERALSSCLKLKDDALFIDTFRTMAEVQAAAARASAHVKEKWDAFRPMEWLMEAGVNFAVLGDYARAREMLDLARPIVMLHWKDQRGPTFYKMCAHLAILSGDRDDAERWRAEYRKEFERKERFDPEVIKPIHLEFDEEFYRMLGDEQAYRATLIEICRSLEPGMREVFEGVDRLLEEGLYTQARTPLNELAPEAKDQRIWRLLSAYVDWRGKVDGGRAREGDERAFEDHMWHAIHSFAVPRQGMEWGAVLEVLGAEEDPIDLHPLKRALALIHSRAGA